jgi:uncharacterized spore protein YtfJ
MSTVLRATEENTPRTAAVMMRDVGRGWGAAEFSASNQVDDGRTSRYNKGEHMEQVESLLKTTLGEVERLLSTRTVVGEPINIEGNTIIPLVAVGFGFGGGGGSGKEQKAISGEAIGAGSGGGGGVKPVAIIIANKDGVRVEAVRKGASTMVEKMGEAVGKIIEKRGEKKA